MKRKLKRIYTQNSSFKCPLKMEKKYFSGIKTILCKAVEVTDTCQMKLSQVFEFKVFHSNSAVAFYKTS